MRLDGGPTLLKRWRLILLVALAVVLVVSASVALVLDRKFEVILSAPRVSHERFADDNTCIRVVFNPPRAAQELKELIPQAEQLSDFVWARVLPYETSLIVDADSNASQARFTLVLNGRRLGPVLTNALNQSDLAARFPQITWDTPLAAQQGRGLVTASGVASLETTVVDAAWMRWGDGLSTQPLPPEGGHLFEAVVDNRAGGAYIIASTIALDWMGYDRKPEEWQSISDMLVQIDTVRLFADLNDDASLRLRGAITMGPHAEEGTAGLIKFFIAMGSEPLRVRLKQEYDLDLEGETSLEGSTVSLDYTLRDADKLIALLRQRSVRG